MLNEIDTAPEAVGLNHATYCLDDNKLRLYLSERVERDSYEYLRKIGFAATPKQECSFAAVWSVAAEDACLALIPEGDDIGDEDYTPEERAADRAERFGDYRDKRRGEASGLADRYDAGPDVYGNQSAARAERQANRRERVRSGALSQWSKAEYWQQRTAGVIAHALHRSEPRVRRGRILRLEAEQRKHEKELANMVSTWNRWKKIESMVDTEMATDAACVVAGCGLCGWNYKHPRKPGERSQSLYGLLKEEADPITGHEAAALYLSQWHPEGPARVGGRSHRISEHYKNRLVYEKAMLENEGGMAGDAEMVVGGFIGRYQILKVNKSRATGRVVSVGIWGPHQWRKDKDGNPVMGIQSINVERFGENAYRAPTELELARFHEEQAAAKKAAKATKPKAPSLINPALEDAEKLQAIWNGNAKSPSPVRQMTQAEYSASSKGSYSVYESVSINEHGKPQRTTLMGRSNGTVMFKVRKGPGFGSDVYRADAVIVITDKPQKPLPWSEMQAVIDAGPQLKNVVPRLSWLHQQCQSAGVNRKLSDEAKALFNDAWSLGLVYESSMSQFGLNDKGVRLMNEHFAVAML